MFLSIGFLTCMIVMPGVFYWTYLMEFYRILSIYNPRISLDTQLWTGRT